jgi:hypothetical protein
MFIFLTIAALTLNHVCHTDTESILEDARMRHAQAILNEKYGMVAGRIFRLLIVHKRLEEKQVTYTTT